MASAASQTKLRPRSGSRPAAAMATRPKATAAMCGQRCHQHISQGLSPPRCSDPKAPASKAAGTSRLSALASACVEPLPTGFDSSAGAGTGGTGGLHAPEPRDRLQRVVELVILDAALAQL